MLADRIRVVSGFESSRGVWITSFMLTPNTILVSKNLSNWNSVIIPFSGTKHISYLCYGNGIFLAISENGTQIATSTDGFNWNVINHIVAETIRGLRFIDGLFYATGLSISNPSRINTSPDGINWTTYNPSTILTDSLYDIVKAGNNIIVGGYDSDYINILYISSSGLGGTFSSKDTKFTNTNKTVNTIETNNANTLIMIGGNGGEISTSVTGSSWTNRNNPFGAIRTIRFFKDKFIICDGNKLGYALDATRYVITKDTGVVINQMNSAAMSEDLFVAGGTGKLYVTKDGIDWNDITLPISERVSSIAYGEVII